MRRRLAPVPCGSPRAPPTCRFRPKAPVRIRVSTRHSHAEPQPSMSNAERILMAPDAVVIPDLAVFREAFKLAKPRVLGLARKATA